MSIANLDAAAALAVTEAEARRLIDLDAVRKYQIIERPLVPPKSFGELCLSQYEDILLERSTRPMFWVSPRTIDWLKNETYALRRAMWHKERL